MKEKPVAVYSAAFQEAATRLLERYRARREGRRDGRRGLPDLPASLTDDNRLPPARPAYFESLQARLDQVSEKYVADAQAEHRRLVEEIYRRAGDVVFHHEAGTLERVHRIRLLSVLGRWAAVTQAQRPQVALAAAQANQMMALYWTSMLRTHRRARRIRRGKEPAPLLRHGDGPEVALDLASWAPETITYDPRWDQPQEFLLDLRFAENDSGRGAKYGPLPGALRLLRIRTA